MVGGAMLRDSERMKKLVRALMDTADELIRESSSGDGQEDSWLLSEVGSRLSTLVAPPLGGASLGDEIAFR